MPLPRFYRLEPERQQAVLDAAAEEFAAHGFHDASLNTLQGRLGLSKGAFYYWFDDKMDLFLSTLEDRLRRLSVAVGGLASGPPAAGPLWPQVEATLRAMMVLALSDPEGLRLLKVAVALGPDSSPRMAALWHAADAPVVAVLAEGQRRGEVRADLPLPLLARVVMGILEAVDRYFLAEGDPPEPAADGAEDAALDALVALYLGLLRRVVAP